MGKIVGFGEIMARLSAPGYLKIIQSDNFNINYTGAEANVLVSLSRFGEETDFVTKMPKNDVTDAAVSKLCQYRVGIDKIIYGGDRLGIYYVEKGASQRPSKVLYDRKYSSIALASRSDFDWDKIFTDAKWFHFSGITAGLGGNLPDICKDACITAKAKGIPISCDLNYRGKLWTPEEAKKVMGDLCKYATIIIGNEEDAEKSLGMKPDDSDVINGKLNKEGYSKLAHDISEKYGCKAVAFTLRKSISASDNTWSAMLYTDKETFFSKEYKIHIVDRVGGGDSFSAGLIYSMVQNYDSQKAIDFAVAASCLKHSIEYDFNLSSVEDVLNLAEGDGSGRVQR